MGLTEKANNYYKMFITWTNEKIRKTFVERNMFDFKHIKGFDRSYIQQPGPMVVLSTPGKSFFLTPPRYILDICGTVKLGNKKLFGHPKIVP